MRCLLFVGRPRVAQTGRHCKRPGQKAGAKGRASTGHAVRLRLVSPAPVPVSALDHRLMRGKADSITIGEAFSTETGLFGKLLDRKSYVEGKRVYGRVDTGGHRIHKKKQNILENKW